MQNVIRQSVMMRLQPWRSFGLAPIRRQFQLWMRRASTRRRLGQLDARELADIGLTEAARRRECAKRFWQR